MANLKIDTDKGEVTISADVLAQIVKDSIESLGGETIVSNSKGKLLDFGMFKNTRMHRSIDIKKTPLGFDVRVYVVLAYSGSISMNLFRASKKIEEDLIKYTSVHVMSVNIVVVGIRSKIIVKNHYDKLMSAK